LKVTSDIAKNYFWLNDVNGGFVVTAIKTIGFTTYNENGFDILIHLSSRKTP